MLRSPAALTLNAGTLLASLLHARVLLPLLPSEWGGQGGKLDLGVFLCSADQPRNAS